MDKRKQIFKVILSTTLVVGGVVLWLLWPKLLRNYGKYGIAFNTERAQRGILPLPEDWTTKNDTETKIWFPPKDEGPVSRSMKEVLVKDGKIIMEMDNIAKSVGNGYDVLSIYYYFNDNDHLKYTYKSAATNGDVPMTKAQADSTLQAWNFRK